MDTLKTFGERLTFLLTEINGNNQSELARYVGVSPQAVQFWAGGSVIPRGKNLEKVALFLNTTPSYLLYGSTPSEAEYEHFIKTTRFDPDPYLKVAEPTNKEEKTQSPHPIKENSFQIPMLNVNGSMGTGSQQPENEIAISHLQVTRDWIRENLSAVSSPSNISMITGLGDSMEPTYKHGDTLFVDTGITNIDLDAVYVMVLNNELYIKRIQRRPDGIWVISDNKLRYDPYLIQRSDLEQIRVVGRVCGTMNFNRI